MRANRSEDTSPEMRVRKALHSSGLRYRLHDRRLPGKPDLVLPSRGVAVFVHGCFWHQHDGCHLASVPRQRVHYWGPKLRRNVERDAEHERVLAAMGWRSVVIWECETTIPERLIGLANRLLEAPVLKSAHRKAL